MPTDANILALLHEANAGEIAAARLALTKSTNARVQSFAHEMIHDHARMERQGALVASALGVTPIALANDSLAAHVTAESAQLTATAQGSAFDKAYIDGQVQDHETVLALLQRYQSAAHHDAVKSTITDAMPVVQKHLDQARAIQVRFGGSSPVALAPAP
jgi:putative membrane protein